MMREAVTPDHPLRFEVVNELHARPSPRLEAPVTAVFIAFKQPQDAAGRDPADDLAHLAALTHRHGAPAPQQGMAHYAGTLGRYELNWESHTEFVSYAAFLRGAASRPFDARMAEIFTPEWQAAAPGKRLAAVIVHVEAMPAEGEGIDRPLATWFARDGLAVANVFDGAAVVASDFRIDAAGFMRFAVFVRPGTGPGRIGRIVQTLLELETYRVMSMLGLARMRALSARLGALDQRLALLMDGLARDHQNAEATLHDLLAISTELEAAATQVSFRLGATQAYGAIVEERLAILRETRFGGRQTLGEFMERRHAPAMRTVTATEARLHAMLDRAARAAELLRTRVDVARSGASRDLLASMDRRAALQLRLQHTVEGLSVVAISYYAVGLAGYVVAPFAHAADIDKGIVTAALVPVVLLAVWAGMRRVKRALHDAPPALDPPRDE